MGDGAPETAVLVIGHGSREPEAALAMQRVIAELRKRCPHRIVEGAFLELADPSIPEGIEACVAQGAGRILLIPYFLHLGSHVRRDLPRIAREEAARHPGLQVVLGDPIGFDSELAAILARRIADAEGREPLSPLSDGDRPGG